MCVCTLFDSRRLPQTCFLRKDWIVYWSFLLFSISVLLWCKFSLLALLQMSAQLKNKKKANPPLVFPILKKSNSTDSEQPLHYVCLQFKSLGLLYLQKGEGETGGGWHCARPACRNLHLRASVEISLTWCLQSLSWCLQPLSWCYSSSSEGLTKGGLRIGRISVFRRRKEGEDKHSPPVLC